MGVTESPERVCEPLAAELSRSPASLFGVILHDPCHGNAIRYCWLGLRHTMTGAICGGVLALREFGLDARNAHATDVFEFGPLNGPTRFNPELVAGWVIGNENRGIQLINDVDLEGHPIIEDTQGNALRCKGDSPCKS